MRHHTFAFQEAFVSSCSLKMSNYSQSYLTDRKTEATPLPWLAFRGPERPPLPLCPIAILTVSRERSLDGTIRAPNGKGT